MSRNPGLRRPTAPGGVGATVWLTGLPSAGKSTIANAMSDLLRQCGTPVEVLDGDTVRAALSPGLGFSRADRDANVRRIGAMARRLARAGTVVLVPVIAPYAAARNEVRAEHAADGVPFFEVHVATPVEVCAQRDVKGLYAKQRRGEIQGLTGVDDPYEVPISPDLRVDAHLRSLAECTAAVAAIVPAAATR